MMETWKVEGTFTMTIIKVNVGPAPDIDAPDMEFDVKFGETTQLDVLRDAVDPMTGDNSTLVVASVTQPLEGGTVTIGPFGKGVVFFPAPGFSGQTEFTYEATRVDDPA